MENCYLNACIVDVCFGMIMKKITLAALALATAATAATTASAADLAPRYTKAPPVAIVSAYNWTGCYVGAEGGGTWGRSRQTNLDPATGAPRDITNPFDMSGGLVGGTVGCNYQVSNFVFGAEGDGSWTNASGSSHNILPFNTASTASTYERAFYTMRGRAGIAFDRVLIYGTGGAAAADVGISASAPLLFGSQNQTVWGWTAGVGIEWAFVQNWSVKAEYLYADFGNPAFFNPAPAPAFANRAGGVHLTDDIVRVGVNYKFDWAAKY